MCICREATLHQLPAWQPALDDAQLHSDCSGNETTPDANRPGAEPGARDSRPRERRNLPRVSHPPQIPSRLVTPPDIPDDPGLASGPWHLDFPLPKPALPPCLLLEGLFLYSGLSPGAPSSVACPDLPLLTPSHSTCLCLLPKLFTAGVLGLACFTASNLSHYAQGGSESWQTPS